MHYLLTAIEFCLLCLLIAAYAYLIEPNLLVVRKVRIKSKMGLRRDKPLRIALISDLHYPRASDFRMVRRAIETSNRFAPDLVFFLGDFFDKNRHDPAILPANIGATFADIRSKYGVYGVLGNHDHWFDITAIREALDSKTEIQLIDNASARIDLPDGPIYVVGVGDRWSKDVHYERAVADVPEDASILLLSHNPDVVEEINDPRIVVQFSGHTHGGQIRLPFVGALFVPSKFWNRYCKGLIDKGNHLLYVNCGVCSMRHVRFLCPPEVTLVEIN